MSKQLLVVFGATGNQGGSVIRAVQEDSKLSSQFRIRGITRDTSKPAAQNLASQGIEVVAVSPLHSMPSSPTWRWSSSGMSL